MRQNASGRQAKAKARVRAFQELSDEERFKQSSETGALIIPQGIRLGDKVLDVSLNVIPRDPGA